MKATLVFSSIFLLCGVLHGVPASIGVLPVQPTHQRSGGSYSSVAARTRSASTSNLASGSTSPSLADAQTMQNALELYQTMKTVIRDVITKAKLTPIGDTQGLVYVENCAEHKVKRTKGEDTKTGSYVIWPTGKVLDGSKQVICDMETEGGGWTVIQRRGYGNVARDKAEPFNRNWKDYKTGFGTPVGDYWIGLDSIHTMGLKCTNELLITLTYFDNTKKSATYSNFTVGPESDNYRLHLSGFTTGDAGDIFEKKHDGMVFNTPDRDNSDKCGASSKSGWWFVSSSSKKWCAYVDLNGELKNKATDEGGMIWRYHSFLRGYSSPAIKQAEMKIRPKCPPSI